MVKREVKLSDLTGNTFTGRGGCWLWLGTRDTNGYAKVGWKVYLERFKTPNGHRIVYELTNGKIPEGMEIDHLCSVRNCLNPSHLEVVTHEENNRRRNENFVKQNPNFPCGHSRENFWVKKDGWYKSGKRKLKPVCRPCYLEYHRAYNTKKRRGTI